ncbi:(SNARE-interacting) vesicle transport protein, putative [Theileria annulata]|uniref:(SNARE-interacting) vesicle transport protein, putative n=1 Tax=Theileria annulata TaxID=5874 RepID=Q4UEH1_THEAN|nr:(SNARE-interacting) vesicle transport protein, putative [Theileria annulata]CAI74518.1 (SNARE-interacting) vesicle transport protein, putative [Theileria annulata]|eukprot:XP_952250.1 (SNARE-interacting) vesicle transport protein, putative [Theileria annulata]
MIYQYTTYITYLTCSLSQNNYSFNPPLMLNYIMNNVNDWYINAERDEEYGDRTHLLQQSRALDESLSNLAQSRSVLNDTNELGANVMSKLLNQRDSIVRTKQLISETQNIQHETRDIITSIGRSEFYTRVLMYLTVVMLVLAIIFIIIYKVLKK